VAPMNIRNVSVAPAFSSHEISEGSPATSLVDNAPQTEAAAGATASTTSISLSEAFLSPLPASILDAVRLNPQPSPLNVPAGSIVFAAGIAAIKTPSTGGRAVDAVIEAQLLDRAQKAGLDSDEVARLKQILDTSPDFKADAKLLDQILPADVNDPFMPNGDRALRTFMDLDEQRRAHPDRITPDIVATLVTGVARSRGDLGLEGVLGEDSADRAARALIEMPQADYDTIKGVLNQAGRGGDVYSDAETERDLILKAVAAREDAYAHPSVIDKVTGLPMTETGDIVNFANTIRGQNRDDLLFRTTVASNDDVLQQRYADSCTPTTLEMLKAEADPIYAWKLHNEDVSSFGLGGFIAQEQAQLMNEAGGMVVPFALLQQWQQLANSGDPMVAAIAKNMLRTLERQGANLEGLANSFDSDTTGRDYHETTLSDDAASRAQAADYMAKLVSEGVDVPIAVEWTNRNWMNPLSSVDTGMSHALLITDVRGHGDSTVFTISDPGTGSTYEVSRKDLISGNTQFGNDGTGRLLAFDW
jgi:hypothetical protein